MTATDDFKPGLRGRASSSYNRAASAFWGGWGRLPVLAKVIVVVALYLVLAVVVPMHFVARIMAPQSGWTAALSFPIGTYILLGIGLNVVVGQAGMLDLGYVGFWAVGGYAYGILAAKQHWDFWLILPIGIIVAAISGLILGAPTLRLRGDYLAIVTLGFGLIISQAITNLSFDGGAQGISSIPHPPSVKGVEQLTYGVLDYKPYWYLVLALIFVAVFAVRRLERSRVGRGWVAIREDEDVAELMGVPTYRFRLWAFAIGAAIGGVGGVFYASRGNAILPGTFSYQVSILVVASVVLGGSGNLPGVIFGAFLVAWIPERFRNLFNYRFLGFGAALVIVMILRPEGLIPSRRRRAEISEGAGGGGMSAPLVPPDIEGAS
jgi:branched-chain amino acid transport system permease protein